MGEASAAVAVKLVGQGVTALEGGCWLLVVMGGS